MMCEPFWGWILAQFILPTVSTVSAVFFGMRLARRRMVEILKREETRLYGRKNAA